MRIEVLTSLYPGPPRPYEGVFAERRWLGMRARGHEVSVTQPLPLAPGPFLFGKWAEIRNMPRRETRGDIEVTRPRYFHVPGRARVNAARFAKVGCRSILSRGTPDVVVCDYAWPAAAAAPILKEKGIPCLVNGRGSDVLEVSGEAGLGDELGGFLKSAGHWCAVSNDLVETMDRLGGAPGRGRLIPNGVNLEIFAIRDRNTAREALGLPLEPKMVLVAGHLIERKDPLLALEVFHRGAPPDALCVFVGRGRLRALIESRAHDLGMADRLRMVGEVKPVDLSTWYAASNCLLLTSKREGRPNVVLEALASGRPALATAAGGTAELLNGWEERLYSRSREVKPLAEKLRALLADSPDPHDLRSSIEHLSWENSLDTLEDCLQVVRNGRG